MDIPSNGSDAALPVGMAAGRRWGRSILCMDTRDVLS